MKESSGNELALAGPETTALFRQATDVAGLCKKLAIEKAITIGGRRYLPVEVWMTIATAHGFMPSVKSVEVIPEVGIKAVAEIKRMSDGMVMASAEGFVGIDETTWFGGKGYRYVNRVEKEVEIKPRAQYAIRSMAQTRAVSRVCRTVFAHVVVLMDADLQTVPAEEMTTDDEPTVTTADEVQVAQPESGGKPAGAEPTAGAEKRTIEVPRETNPKLLDQFRDGRWEGVKIHFGSNYKGMTLGELSDPALRGWFSWQPQPYQGKISDDDKLLRAALDVAEQEAFKK